MLGLWPHGLADYGGLPPFSLAPSGGVSGSLHRKDHRPMAVIHLVHREALSDTGRPPYSARPFLTCWSVPYLIPLSIRLLIPHTGPGCLSINSPTATSLYLSTEKSEAYRLPKHNGAVALFFKQDTSAIHRDRRRVWSEFFTRSRYLAHSLHASVFIVDAIWLL